LSLSAKLVPSFAINHCTISELIVFMEKLLERGLEGCNEGLLWSWTGRLWYWTWTVLLRLQDKNFNKISRLLRQNL
jgi:hypothetical protein